MEVIFYFLDLRCRRYWNLKSIEIRLITTINIGRGNCLVNEFTLGPMAYATLSIYLLRKVVYLFWLFDMLRSPKPCNAPTPLTFLKKFGWVLGIFGKLLMLEGDFVSFRLHVLKKFEFWVFLCSWKWI